MFYDHLKQQLRRFHADDPYERCGLLLTRKASSAPTLVEVTNFGVDATYSFRMRTDEVQQRLNDYGSSFALYGILHTHPGRSKGGWVPSRLDQRQAGRMPGIRHFLWHPYTRSLVGYREHEVVWWWHVYSKTTQPYFYCIQKSDNE